MIKSVIILLSLLVVQPSFGALMLKRSNSNQLPSNVTPIAFVGQTPLGIGAVVAGVYIFYAGAYSIGLCAIDPKGGYNGRFRSLRECIGVRLKYWLWDIPESTIGAISDIATGKITELETE